ncbi:MAG: GntR family transcriptional regulator [bacterium]|nr:GntR family transcriptional regulator [bacterium]
MQAGGQGLAPITPIRRRLVTDEVIDRLIVAIAIGAFPPGHRFVEESLAAEFGVSRVPIREAMRELWLQGIVSSSPGRGWKVAAFDDRQIREVCSVRIALETLLLAGTIPRLRADPSRFAEIDKALDVMRKGAADGHVEQVQRADVEFHRAALSVAGHSLGLGIWEGISRQVLIIFGLEIRSHPDLDAVVVQHEQLRRFLAVGDPSDLASVLREHIAGWWSSSQDRPENQNETDNWEMNHVSIA